MKFFCVFKVVFLLLSDKNKKLLLSDNKKLKTHYKLFVVSFYVDYLL